MGLGDFVRRLLGMSRRGNGGRGVDELARRIGTSVEELRAVRPVYRPFDIPKRSGGVRRVLAPEPALKSLQRRILRRLLDRLVCHEAATGFERGESIVTNAAWHVRRSVVVRMDVKDFFASTAAARVREFFLAIGWGDDASDLLIRLCTHAGGLPQGAPTSPRLSNLVNYVLDERLNALAAQFDAMYTRYADDLTFSFAEDSPEAVHAVIRLTKLIVEDEGYKLHMAKKLRIYHRHHRQLVNGLVVNEHVNLPRATRRWLRAVEHRVTAGRPVTLTPAQLDGWRALDAMVRNQRGGTDS